MRYRIVDVFSDRPLAGNALCVVLDEFPGERMQELAREVNLSETTFPRITGPGAYKMRVFTPGSELPFAGHPTIGTAWVMGSGRWEQTTSGACVTVDADASGAVMGQPDPDITEVDVGGVAQALGLPGVEGAFRSEAGGTVHILVPTQSPLAGLNPNQAAVAAECNRLGGISLCAFTRLADDRLHARVFLPLAGVPEDPGTGSAAGPLALLAHQRWGTAVDVTIQQGAEMGRPCVIEAHAEAGNLRVGGRVTAVAEGRFDAASFARA